MPRLIIETAEKTDIVGRSIALPEDPRPVTIGRRRPAAIALGDRRASREHARIFLRYGVWTLEDLESRNGVGYCRAGGGQWTQITKQALSDGDRIRIGSTTLRFSADPTPETTPEEIAGCRVDALFGSECGVSRFAAWQLAMDRAVRLDVTALARPDLGEDDADQPSSEALDEAAHTELDAAIRAASRLTHKRIGSLIQASVDRQTGAGLLVFRMGAGIEFGEPGAEPVLAQGLPVRLRAFALLADAVLARGKDPALRAPIGLAHVGWTEACEPWLPAIELSTWLAERRRATAHLPSLIPYVPPEHISSKLAAADGDGSFQSLVYNLGAVGYHLLTGTPPLGAAADDSTLKNHLKLAPTPADLLEKSVPAEISALLERMLAKTPAERPATPGEILDVVRPFERVEVSGPAVGSEPEWEELVDADETAAVAPPTGASNGRPAPARRNDAERYDEPAPRTSLALLLPLWVVLWAGLFVATRILTAMLLERFGG